MADKELEIDALREISRGKLVGPSRRRRAVVMLQDRIGLSERRACQIVGQHRSTERHQPAEPDPDSELRTRLRCFAKRHPARSLAWLVQLWTARRGGDNIELSISVDETSTVNELPALRTRSPHQFSTEATTRAAMEAA